MVFIKSKYNGENSFKIKYVVNVVKLKKLFLLSFTRWAENYITTVINVLPVFIANRK